MIITTEFGTTIEFSKDCEVDIRKASNKKWLLYTVVGNDSIGLLNGLHEGAAALESLRESINDDQDWDFNQYIKKAGKYVFVPEKLDADSERERMKAENDSISFDDPSLEDFFGYNLRADEARFDAENRRLHKNRQGDTMKLHEDREVVEALNHILEDYPDLEYDEKFTKLEERNTRTDSKDNNSLCVKLDSSIRRNLVYRNSIGGEIVNKLSRATGRNFIFNLDGRSQHLIIRELNN